MTVCLEKVLSMQVMSITNLTLNQSSWGLFLYFRRWHPILLPAAVLHHCTLTVNFTTVSVCCQSLLTGKR